MGPSWTSGHGPVCEDGEPAKNHNRKERGQEVTGGAVLLAPDAHTLEPPPRRDGVGRACRRRMGRAGAAPDVGSAPA